MTQPALFQLTPDDGLTCAYNWPWLDHFTPLGCPRCEAEVARSCAAFDAAVARGEMDADGYRPSERKALARKMSLKEKT